MERSWVFEVARKFACDVSQVWLHRIDDVANDTNRARIRFRSM